MANERDVGAAFDYVARNVRAPMNEDDVERLFQPVYEALDYRVVGKEILGKRPGRSGIPDVRLVNEDGSIQCVVELKRPAEDLADHVSQLTGYLDDLKAPYGLLSNGSDVWVFQRQRQSISRILATTAAALAEQPEAVLQLSKQSVDLLELAQIRERLESAVEEGLELTDIAGLPAEHFFQTFRLFPDSAIGALVAASKCLLTELLERSSFVSGAYEFWSKTYARELSKDDVPTSWKPFLQDSSERDVSLLSYALETAYLLTARLMLAKVIQDHDRAGRLTNRHLAARFLVHLEHEANDRDSSVPPTAYLTATIELFNRYATSLFTSLYAQDVFDWWRDFRLAPDEVQRSFSLAVARTVVSLVRFNFKDLEGDLLGELYQHYFDPETRKALGEFYTPPEIVRYILDEVGYDGQSNSRLLDPATGSGTFLVEALKRYLEANAHRDPVETLNDITREFALVAFDVNPFAVLMAQVNAAAILVPLYIRAVEQDPKVVLRRLPIVRTDSLRQEAIEGELREATGHGAQGPNRMVGINFGSEEIEAQVELPIRDPSAEGTPLRVGIRFPSLDSARRSGRIRNERHWLLALQSVFAAVEVVSQAYDEGLRDEDLPDLARTLTAELSHVDESPGDIAAYLLPYAQGVWELLQELKVEYGDGRFLKTLEDLMLGLVLKHYLLYDFVVGNPPYVRVQNLPDVHKNYWVDKYQWAHGNFDIYIPFIERAFAATHPWLRNGGKLGYILSNRFLKANYAEELRRSLPRAARVKSLTDFQAATFTTASEGVDTRIFRDALVYPAILVAERRAPDGRYTFAAARFMPTRAPISVGKALTLLREAQRQLSTHPYQVLQSDEEPFADVFLESSDSLCREAWLLMPATERQVFEKIDAIGREVDPRLDARARLPRRLQSYTATESGAFQGIVTGLDGVLVLKELERDEQRNLVRVIPRGGGDPVWVELQGLRPFVFGRDVERWSVGWKDWWVIYPYFQLAGAQRLLPSTEYWEFEVVHKQQSRRAFMGYPDDSPRIDRVFPRLWEYLKSHEDALRARENGRFARGSREEWRWYDLSRPQNLEAASLAPKLLLQTAARKPEVAVDTRCVLFAGSGTHNAYGLALTGPRADAIAGLLASSAADYYIKHVSAMFAGGFYSYGDQFIKALPIPDVDPKRHRQIVGEVQLLTELTEQAKSLSEAIGNFPESAFQYVKDREAPVPDLEQLSRLASLATLPQVINAEDVSIAKDLFGETTFTVGRGTIRASGVLADLIAQILSIRGVQSRSDLAATYVPMREAYQAEFLEILSSWRSEVERIANEIIEHEATLEHLAFEAYGLDERDKGVIEKFLRYF